MKRVFGTVSFHCYRKRLAPMSKFLGEVGPNMEFDGTPIEDEEPDEADIEDYDLMLPAKLVVANDMVMLSWEEDEISGMKGAFTKIAFSSDDKGVVTMARNGIVCTTLTFQKSVHFTCMYNTPFLSFPISVEGIEVDNRLLEDGEMNLDYIIELGGSCMERSKVNLTFKPDETTAREVTRGKKVDKTESGEQDLQSTQEENAK